MALNSQPGQVPLAGAEPADPGRQALEGNPFRRQPHPALQACRCPGTARAPPCRWHGCRPGRRTARPSGTVPCPRRTAAGCRRGRTRGSRRPSRTGQLGLTADGVAVVEDLGAGVLEADHRLHVRGHRLPRPVGELLGLGRRVVVPLLQLDADRQVGQRVVRAGLVGDDVDLAHRGGAARAASRRRCRSRRWRAARRRFLRVQGERDAVRRGRRRDVEVSGVQPSAGPARVALDAQARRRRSCVTASGWAPPIPPRPAVTVRVRPARAGRAGSRRRRASRRPRRTSRRCPARCPGTRCRSTSRRSSGRTWSGPSASSRRNSGQVAQSPTRFEFAISTRGAHSWVRSTPTGRPDCTSSVSSCRRSVRVRQMASKLAQSRAARPVPP